MKPGPSVGLTSAQVDTAIANRSAYEVKGLLKHGVMTAVIATVARASNVATITTDVPHGMIVGQKFLINATTDNTFDATSSSAPATVLAVPSTTSFTYASTGTDKAQTADSGALTSWELVDDGGHVPLRNMRISAIAADGITLTWDDFDGTTDLLSATLGQHSNNGANEARSVAVGATTWKIQLIQRLVVYGRFYYNGGGANCELTASWTKTGDTLTAYYNTVANGVYFGNSSKPFTSNGGPQPDAYPPFILIGHSTVCSPVHPNYQVSPFTAAGYRPDASAMYCQIVNRSTGAIMTKAEIEATSVGQVQVTWQRVGHQVQVDHTMPTGSCTVFLSGTYKPD